MQFIIQPLQRDLGEETHKLGFSSWGIRVEYLSRCRWKLGNQLVEKNINITSRVVRHVKPQHNCILKSSFALILFILLFLPFKFNFFISSYFYYTPFSLAYKLSFHQGNYKQISCGLDTRSSVLIFTTCDKIGTLANQLTSFWRRWRDFVLCIWLSHILIWKQIFFFIFLFNFCFYFFYLDNLHSKCFSFLYVRYNCRGKSCSLEPRDRNGLQKE